MADPHTVSTTDLLQVDDLRTYFDNDEGLLKAVDGISFAVKPGETLGVVGESGCGKSVTATSIMNLLPRSRGRIAGGHIYYRGAGVKVDVTTYDPDDRAMRALRGREIAMVFQEPMTALNPVYTVGYQIEEAIRSHFDVSKAEARSQAIGLLEKVGIAAPQHRVDEYPFEMSGGMRQRVMIALALSCSPKLLIADEPTTALDVTVEAQILRLIQDLQQELGMALIIITHDLGVIGEMADRVIVMYMGKIVEEAPVDDIFYDPKHPYTRALLRSLPVVGQRRRLVPIGGSIPNPYLLGRQCYFADRCPHVMDICRDDEPGLALQSPDHRVSCFLYT